MEAYANDCIKRNPTTKGKVVGFIYMRQKASISKFIMKALLE